MFLPWHKCLCYNWIECLSCTQSLARKLLSNYQAISSKYLWYCQFRRMRSEYVGIYHKSYRCVTKYWITDLSMPSGQMKHLNMLWGSIFWLYYSGLQQNIGLPICPCHIGQIILVKGDQKSPKFRVLYTSKKHAGCGGCDLYELISQTWRCRGALPHHQIGLVK